MKTCFADQFLVMTYSNSHTKPKYTKHTRGKLGTIAIASVFLFTISAVTPANATTIDDTETPMLTTSSSYEESSEGAQSLAVPDNAVAVTVARDSYTATSEAELSQIIATKEAEALAAVEAARQVSLASVQNGERLVSTAVVAPNQVIPASGILAAAQQWVGVVPYGSGNHPSDTFSCDGYVQYVFAQNGISLPRGADAQGRSGTPISQADAKAGDLLWWPGQHIGIYDGNGGMYDSPMPGRMVQHRSTLWGNPVFVRL